MPRQRGKLRDESNIDSLSRSLNGIEQAIVVVDESGRIQAVNRYAERIYGWKSSKLKNRSISEFILEPSLLDRLHGRMEELQQGESTSSDITVKNTNGVHSSARINIKLTQDGNHILIFLSDPSDGWIEVQKVRMANQLLEKINLMLGEGEPFERTIENLTELIVLWLADWCAIFTIQPDKSIECIAIAPAEIAEAQSAYEWLHNDLPNDEADGLPAVINGGSSKLVAEVSPIRRAAEAGIKSYMLVPLNTGRQTFGVIAFVKVDSDLYFSSADLALAENIAAHISGFVKQAQLMNESQRLNTDLEKNVSERIAEHGETMAQLKQSDEVLQTLFRVSNKLNATLDIELILDELAQEAINMVNGESGFAGLRNAEGMTVHKYYERGVAIPFEHTWAIGEGIPGWVLKYKVPYGTSDAANDPLIQKELAINANVRSIICTPILDTVGEVIGYFDIRNKQGAEGFSINDQEMLLTLAPVASIAIQNALTYRQRMAALAELNESTKQLQELAASLEVAREEERTQIARELHDELGQALTALKFDLAWLTEELGGKDEVLEQKAKDITSQMNTIIKSVRRIATELRPGMLDDLGLIASMEWYAHDFEKRSGIKCAVSHSTQDLPLAYEQSLALYRIFQEALTNVARHAGAKRVDVSLSVTGDMLNLEIIDDGRGIRDEEIHGENSLGLIGMRERARNLGGVFTIHGMPARGSEIKVSLPITRKL